MPSVTRDIHIAAPPDVVRRLVTDPARRAGWLEPDAAPDRTPHIDPDGTVTWTRDDGEVRIEIVPDGDGTHVTVTEELARPTRGTDPRTDTSRPVLLAA